VAQHFRNPAVWFYPGQTRYVSRTVDLMHHCYLMVRHLGCVIIPSPSLPSSQAVYGVCTCPFRLHIRSGGEYNPRDWGGFTNWGCDPGEQLPINQWTWVCFMHQPSRMDVRAGVCD